MLVILLAKQLTVLLNETHPDERALAVRVRADEMIRAPGLVQSSHERPSVYINKQEVKEL